MAEQHLPNDTPEEQHQTQQERVEEIAESILDLSTAGEYEEVASALELLRPVDQADVVVELSTEARTAVIEEIGADAAARIVEEMRAEDAAMVVEDLDVELLADILDEVSPDTAADVLHAMDEEDAGETLHAMERADRVEELLSYADDTAGGQMTTEYVAVQADASPGLALDVLRLIDEDRGDFSTIYVVDAEKKLVGWVRLRRLALARPYQVVRDLMEEDVVSVDASVDQEECARIVSHYDLDSLPVTDETGRLLGVIDADDLADVAEEEATEDMFRMAGMQGDRSLNTFRRSVRTRLPWLTLNLATTFLAAAVVGLFESTIQQLALLAVFLPVVAGQGGIGGTQTLTLVVRGIALGEITGRQARRVLTREAMLGGFHGFYLAVLVGVVAWIWSGDGLLAGILAVAMVGNMLMAGLVGAGVPLLLRSLRQDPAVSSAVVVTTATDVTGFLLFLGLAAMFVERMV